MSTIRLLSLDPPRDSTDDERRAVLLPKLHELTDGMRLPFGTLTPNSIVRWRLFVKSSKRDPLMSSTGPLFALRNILMALPDCLLGVPIGKIAKVKRLLQELGHTIEVYYDS